MGQLAMWPARPHEVAAFIFHNHSFPIFSLLRKYSSQSSSLSIKLLLQAGSSRKQSPQRPSSVPQQTPPQGPLEGRRSLLTDGTVPLLRDQPHSVPLLKADHNTLIPQGWGCLYSLARDVALYVWRDLKHDRHKHRSSIQHSYETQLLQIWQYALGVTKEMRMMPEWCDVDVYRGP